MLVISTEQEGQNSMLRDVHITYSEHIGNMYSDGYYQLTSNHQWEGKNLHVSWPMWYICWNFGWSSVCH